MNIDELIAEAESEANGILSLTELKQGINWLALMPRAAWLDEPGFDRLYVRVTRRFIDGKWMPSIDLANIKATNPGNGTFTKLIERLNKQYTKYAIYIESVTNPRFSVKLLEMGFIEMKYIPYSYYILPEE